MKWYDRPFHTVDMNEVLEGCTDSILDAMSMLKDNQKKEIAAYRIKKCNSCSIFVNGDCDITLQRPHKVTGELVNGCGCIMKCKKFILNAECPAGEWKSVILK